MSRIAIFTVYGAAHVSHIKSLLIPTLARQTCGGIDLHLINYAAPEALFSASDNTETLSVHDHSAQRAPGHLGFGEGINVLFQVVQPSSYFLILNPDTLPDPRAIAEMQQHFDITRTGMVEARQWPREHPKEYDLQSGHTAWASGACALVSSEAFASTGGFDPLYFMYCEDVDLSWRMWLKGYDIIHAPKASIMHFTGLLHYRHDRFYLEHFYSARNFLLIARKFFGTSGERKAMRMLRASSYPRPFKEAVLADYANIKPKIESVTSYPAHPQIRLHGFGAYHRLMKYPRHFKGEYV